MSAGAGAAEGVDDVDRSAKLLTLRDFEAVARERLDPVHYDYVAGGARDEVTVRANEAGFQQVRLLPRVLRGRAKLDLGVTLFGDHSSMPVVISPTAFHKLADPEGELATARAAALADTIMIVSMASTTDVRNVADAARAAVPGRDPRLWFQLYLQPDLEDTAALVRRATEAGCSALVVTVDSPVLGVHDRNKRNGFTDLPAGMYCENLRDLRGGEPGSVRQIAMSPELSWEHVDWLRGITSLPVVLKGVLHPQDARLALRHGVDGLLLSNHGGRQLDTVPATIELLPEFLDAVGGAVPVLVDGGVRRGTDVAKAVALGAAAAGVGRPIFWALAADGQRGVSRALEILRGEIEHTFALCGAGSVREMTRDLVRAPVGGGLR